MFLLWGSHAQKKGAFINKVCSTANLAHSTVLPSSILSHTHTHTFTHAHIHTCMHATHTHTHIHTHTYTPTYAANTRKSTVSSSLLTPRHYQRTVVTLAASTSHRRTRTSDNRARSPLTGATYPRPWTTSYS